VEPIFNPTLCRKMTSLLRRSSVYSDPLPIFSFIGGTLIINFDQKRKIFLNSDPHRLRNRFFVPPINTSTLCFPAAPPPENRRSPLRQDNLLPPPTYPASSPIRLINFFHPEFDFHKNAQKKGLRSTLSHFRPNEPLPKEEIQMRGI